MEIEPNIHDLIPIQMTTNKEFKYIELYKRKFTKLFKV